MLLFRRGVFYTNDRQKEKDDDAVEGRRTAASDLGPRDISSAAKAIVGVASSPERCQRKRLYLRATTARQVTSAIR